MRKVIFLTKEVEESLNFILDAAMKFCGYPIVQPHKDVVAKAIQDIKEDVEGS